MHKEIQHEEKLQHEKRRRLRVAVYCSSRPGLPPEVEAGASMIAECIGECGADLVYGGVNAGLMHTVAESAARAGAEVYGIVPADFTHRADPICTHIIHTSDLSQRKSRMIEMADIFVVLPGGIGTIDEWISTLSHIMVRELTDPAADAPILVWNHQDMYAGAASQLRDTDSSVYARGKRVDRSRLFATAAELAESLRSLLAGRGD